MHPGSQYYGGGEMASAAHPSVRSVPLTLMPNAVDVDGQMGHFKQEHGGYHGLDGVSSSNAIYTEHDGSFANHAQPHHSNHGQTHAQAAGLVGLMDDSAGSSSAVKREAELDRTIVGSLTTSYPFLRDGLCKKTISIQVEGSTQHLISYYKIDDVHNGRLAIPSNLPEIAALSISPIFLHKSNFRYPPIVEIGPDGMPRYVAEATDNAVRTPGHHQQYQQFGHDGSGTEAYGRPEGVAEGQMPFYPQQSNHHHLSHDNAQIEQQGFGRAGHNTYESTEAYTSNDFGNQAAHNEQTWSSNPAAGGNSGADANRDFSSRPGTSHDQGYHQFSDEAVDGGSTNDSGLEKVMLTRPAS
ncbi:hypothetical protein NDA16_004456 [Ustilago loliicola]|nr:hypothetical protein NDA16_004456 [Ustilago loliicola]